MASATAKYVIRLEDKTKRAFKAIGRSLKSVTKKIFSMKTGLISAAGIAGLGFLIKRSMNATDEMAKMSRAIGVSVEELQALRHAAALGGLIKQCKSSRSIWRICHAALVLLKTFLRNII